MSVVSPIDGFVRDVVTKVEGVKDVNAEDREKYELLDNSTFRTAKNKVLKEYKHVFEELAK